MPTSNEPGPDPEHPIVEPSPDGARDGEQGELSKGALKLRIRQQEILAELGAVSLQRTPFRELLERTVQLAAQGLEAELCKILERIVRRMDGGVAEDPEERRLFGVLLEDVCQEFQPELRDINPCTKVPST